MTRRGNPRENGKEPWMKLTACIHSRSFLEKEVSIYPYRLDRTRYYSDSKETNLESNVEKFDHGI